jgi:hypothetical protein
MKMGKENENEKGSRILPGSDYGFIFATTCRFAQLPFGAFVRKLSASGYPLHLPQAIWVNCQIPTVKLKPTSHMFYTACPTSPQFEQAQIIED